MKKPFLFIVLFILAPLLTVMATDVNYTACPRNLQLYPRNLTTDTAVVPIRGTVENGTPDALILRVYRDEVLNSAVTQMLVFAESEASFSFEPVIDAELSSYNFEVWVLNDGVETLSMQATNVVAGDAYIIQGQSNADAMLYTGSASENENPFVRTFGMNSADIATTTNNVNWLMATGDGSQNVVGGVGQWGLRMGRLLVEQQNVPVAILNGAHGGMPIRVFRRNDADPGDLNSNYGRLLYRARLAGLTNGIRACLWYQGESDNNEDGAVHEEGFVDLCEDWMEDYPSVEHIYLHQLREGCGVDRGVMDLRNRQRLLPDTYSYMSVMSTTGINGHEGCHYAYENGYKLIGDHLAALLAVDLYGSTNTANTTAPNVEYMYFSKPGFDEITIQMREPDDPLTFDAAAIDDFILEGSTVLVTNGVVSSNNNIVLSLNGDASGAEGLSYIGHSWDGAWVTNAAGVGLLTFYNPFTATSSVPPAVSVTPAEPELYLNGFRLSWEKTPNASSYLIRIDGEDYAITTSLEYLIAGLDAGTTVQYEIIALNVFGASPAVTGSVTLWPAPDTVPDPPENPAAQALSSSSISLTWDGVTNASGYRVFRDGTDIGTVVNSTTLIDEGLVADTAYSYEVQSENEIGTSVRSAPVVAKTQVLSPYLHVPEAAGFELVYELDIYAGASYKYDVPVSYSIDRTDSIKAPFDRIAYWLELDDEWVFVSMNAFTSDVKKIGLPHNQDNPDPHQQIISNMNVYASAGAGVTTGTNLSGNIEMWYGDYGSSNEADIPNASDAVCDFGDQNYETVGPGYGSFQVHNYEAEETVFAYNGWGGSGGRNGDIGIGNSSGEHPDWTTAGNVPDYTTRKLYVFVRVPDGQPLDYTETFESYPDGFDVRGTNGWLAASATNAVVTTNSSLVSSLASYSEGCGYPVPSAGHDKVLEMNGAAGNYFDTPTNQIVWIDYMTQPAFGALPIDERTLDGLQAAVGFTFEGHPAVWHCDLAGGSNRWAVVDNVTIPENDWARVTLKLDYQTEDALNNTRYFQVRVNGVLLTNVYAWTSNDGTGTTGGSWFAMSSEPDRFYQVSCTAKALDDFLVTTNNPLARDVTVVSEQGQADPPVGTHSYTYGDRVLLSVTNRLFTQSINQFICDGWELTGQLPAAGSGTNVTVALTNDLALTWLWTTNNTVTANGTPEWWLANYGLSAGADTLDVDNDGVLTWEEWAGDTNPTNGASVLQVTGIDADGSSLQVFWKGGVQATQWLERCTNLVSGAWRPVFTNHPPTAESADFLDADAPDASGFYRVKAAR